MAFPKIYIPPPPLIKITNILGGSCRHDFMDIPLRFNSNLNQWNNKKHMLTQRVCVKCKYRYKEINFDPTFEEVKLFYQMERLLKHAYNI